MQAINHSQNTRKMFSKTKNLLDCLKKNMKKHFFIDKMKLIFYN